MRRLFLLLAAVSSTAIAQPVAQPSESDQLNAELGSLVGEYDKLAADRAKLTQRRSDLDWALSQLKPKVTQYTADKAAWESRNSQQVAKVNDHNGRCGGTYKDQGYVNACNAEADRLDADSAVLRQQLGYLEQTRVLLKQNLDVHDTEAAKVDAQNRADYEKMKRNYDRQQGIIRRLREIALQNDDCKAAVKLVDANPDNMAYKERMHAICGSMFDGNR